MAEINHGVVHNPEALAEVLKSILTDLTNLRSAFNTVVTKLNSDGGVSDTNYAQATTLSTTGNTN